ncbi:EFR1 family ferrodoxin [Anaerosacchariphilus polymeriproducens]|uniref:Ferredoxin n=1 Tax=Anaerosacchariphilus polymeriproducens TaxID=1812858 RepID=A0A371AQP3_9FIRM|nr:EFR1 family ferrodoxin [Anaerosacchariphilus polymeriproducens]RDU21889.1 hypothetical protein DWV06_18070 [Anaerosacchariphilus polymeriproducens]
MSATLYYFTGTGNSLFITKTIAAQLEDTTLIPINQVKLSKEIFVDTDIVGVIYPTYFLEAPDVVKEFAKRLKVSPKSHLFLYSNYGAMSGNSLYNLYEVFKENGAVVSAAYEVALPDNSIIFPTKPEDQEKMLVEGKMKIEKDAKLIQKRCATKMPQKRVLDKALSSTMKFVNHIYLGMDKIEIVDSKCTNCNICSKVCSSNNIKAAKETPLVGKNCAMCFSCVHYCPQQAIRFKRMKPTENFQYSHPDISLKDIMSTRK